MPLSIIIVGVGAADFTDMNELDGDDNTNENLRDLVQFVAMKDYANGADGARLAKDTLIEVPKQVTDYFKKQNVNLTLCMTKPFTHLNLFLVLTK